MANKIILKKSSEAAKVPATSDLTYGELALNYADGKLYFKNASNVIKSFTSSDTIGALQNRYEYTATAGQTTFSAEYVAPNVDVFYNGVKLTNNIDYTATNGTSVVLAAGAVAGDAVDIVAYTAAISSAYQPVLVSGTNIKTINGTSLLGSGDISTSNGMLASFGITIDGGGSVVTTGDKGYVRVPYACIITGWTLLSDIAGSIVIDVWKDSYSNYPPTLADSIAGSEKPTLTSAIKNENTAVTTWSTAVAAGDIIGFSVTSVATVQKVYLSINTVKV